MIFKLYNASSIYEEKPTEIEINSLNDLMQLEKRLRDKASKDALFDFPCNLIVDFECMEITFYDYYVE